MKQIFCSTFHRRYHWGMQGGGKTFCLRCDRSWGGPIGISDRERLVSATMNFFDAYWREKDEKFSTAFKSWYDEEKEKIDVWTA
jgi:hypothetical protein